MRAWFFRRLSERQIKTEPYSFDLLPIELPIGIVTVIVVDEDPETVKRSGPRKFQPAHNIRVEGPIQLLECFEVRPEDRGHDERPTHESFNGTAAPRRPSQFDPCLYFQSVQVGRLAMQ